MNNIKPGTRIPLEGTINTRDLGGYQTKDGRTIRYGRLIRTDCLSHITDKDIRYLTNVLHARYEVDMRGYDEIQRKPDRTIPGVTFLHMPIQEELNKGYEMNPHTNFDVEDKDIKGTIDYLFRMDKNGDMSHSFEKVYRDMLKPFGAKHYEEFLRLCMKNKEGTILFHCADGKDRSGLAAAILLLTLGVDRETVIQDYLRTNENTKTKAEYREHYLRDICHIRDEIVISSIKMVAGVRRNWLEAAFDEMEKQAGSIDDFILEKLHFTKEDQKELQDNYLEQ